MGQIQREINQAITGTSYLLGQSGVFDDIKAERKANKAGEKALKENQATYDAKMSGLNEMQNLNKDNKEAVDTIVSQKEDAELEKNQNEANIRLNTPKYRAGQLAENAKSSVEDEYFNKMEKKKQDEIERLAKRQKALENEEKTKRDMEALLKQQHANFASAFTNPNLGKNEASKLMGIGGKS